MNRFLVEEKQVQSLGQAQQESTAKRSACIVCSYFSTPVAEEYYPQFVGEGVGTHKGHMGIWDNSSSSF